MSKWQIWQKAKKFVKSCLTLPEKKKIHVAMFETVLLHTDKELLKIYSDYALARSKKISLKSVCNHIFY
ncbi:hypothetical protein [Methanosarcina barkeri]|uniref:hypothetical protein n=1 Tax=Methanosarcina barkeri TaxID=2208 RepID=UPI001FB50A66|nr:hypothetical protein [Methanosarcina barkeri]